MGLLINTQNFHYKHKITTQHKPPLQLYTAQVSSPYLYSISHNQTIHYYSISNSSTGLSVFPFVSRTFPISCSALPLLPHLNIYYLLTQYRYPPPPRYFSAPQDVSLLTTNGCGCGSTTMTTTSHSERTRLNGLHFRSSVPFRYR